MGVIYKASCPECDYSKEFYLGGGLRSINLDWSIRVLREEQQEEIRRMEKKGAISHFSVENKLTKCQNCSQNSLNRLSEKTIIKIRDKSNHTYIYGERCSICGKELEIFDGIEKDMQPVSCPECGEAFLEFIQAGRWD